MFQIMLTKMEEMDARIYACSKQKTEIKLEFICYVTQFSTEQAKCFLKI